MSSLVIDFSVYDGPGANALTGEEITRHLFRSHYSSSHVAGTLPGILITILGFVDNGCHGHIVIIVFEERASSKKLAPDHIITMLK
jgi:hypothetical protein